MSDECLVCGSRGKHKMSCRSTEREFALLHEVEKLRVFLRFKDAAIDELYQVNKRQAERISELLKLNPQMPNGREGGSGK